MLLEAKMVLMFGEIRREWKQHGEQGKVVSGVPVTFWFLSGFYQVTQVCAVGDNPASCKEFSTCTFT